MIPLRPELIEFMLAESLGRLASCSKTLRTDVRDTNAWTLLAAVQCPPQKAPTPESRERDAIARVQSHMLRRRLAANLSIFAPNAPPPPPELRNNFTDFTYFLRIEDNGTVIWEGDLTADPGPLVIGPDGFYEEAQDYVKLVAPGSMRASICAEKGLATYLAKGGLDEDGDEDFDDSCLNRLKLSMVAVREADSAMVSIGCFKLKVIAYDEDPLDYAYIFEAQHPVFSSKEGDDMYVPFDLKASVSLELIRRPRGRATIGALYLSLGFHVGEPNEQTLDDNLNRAIFQIMLTHLAGSQTLSRERVLAHIKYWYGDPPEQPVAQTLGAMIREGHEGIRTWLRSGALRSSTQFAEAFYTVISVNAASCEQLVSRPWRAVVDMLLLDTFPLMVQEDFKRAFDALKLEVLPAFEAQGY
jgi:hypothetical protein